MKQSSTTLIILLAIILLALWRSGKLNRILDLAFGK